MKHWRGNLKKLVPTLISLLGVPEIDSSGIQALLMLTVRITREVDIAHEFLQVIAKSSHLFEIRVNFRMKCTLRTFLPRPLFLPRTNL